jgi:glycine/D-amino acid oxidase-like deaminating enzyme
MAMSDIFHPDFSTNPYWWEHAAPTTTGSVPVPEETDVAIIGSGYTGLNAAIELADRGHRVTVLEAREFGHGASSRSGGHVSSGLSLGKAASGSKPSPIIKQLGIERYNLLLEEAAQSMGHLESVIERENIACHYRRGGRFVAAYSSRHFNQLAAKISILDRDGASGCQLVSAEDQHEEIGSDFYYGGMTIERSGKLHPSLYHQGLLNACQRRDITLCAHSPVTDVKQSGSGFMLTAGKAEIHASEVLLATNGYSKQPSPWLRRRVIPLASCIIATEELGEDVTSRLILKDRSINDTKRVLSFFRVSPDGKRLLFGGRESFFTSDPRVSGKLLFDRMVSVYPELAKVRITHSWSGMIAMSFDHMPHIGQRKGLHYCVGCNGSGVAMMSYLGYRAALNISGGAQPSAFDGLSFPTRPTYTGHPWFLPLVGGYFKTMDRLDRSFG